MVIVERFWTESQFQKLAQLGKKFRIPDMAIEEMQKTVQILDSNYGEGRDVDKDDGGYILLLLSEDSSEIKREYDILLEKYHLQREMAEFEDVIARDKETEWHSDLYLAGSEYGIAVVYPIKRKEAERWII